MAAGIAAGAHAIACNAGSTDIGPAYLATGCAKYSRDAVKSDLSILMRAQVPGRPGMPEKPANAARYARSGRARAA